MKAKTLIELLTLSTNIYMITKDEKFLNNLNEMAQKGKAKLGDWVDELGNEDESEEKLMEKLIHKAHQAREEFEHKMEEVAKKVYEKVNIAHTDQVKMLEEKIMHLRNELTLIQAGLSKMQGPEG